MLNAEPVFIDLADQDQSSTAYQPGTPEISAEVTYGQLIWITILSLLCFALTFSFTVAVPMGYYMTLKTNDTRVNDSFYVIPRN